MLIGIDVSGARTPLASRDREAGWRRASKPRSGRSPWSAIRTGRARQRTRGALHGRTRGNQAQRRDPCILSAPAQRR